MKYLVKIQEDESLQIIHKTDARHFPRGGNYIFIEGVDTKYPLISEDEDGKKIIIENTAPKEIEAKYNEMVTDIYDEMEVVFGTRNDVSASAFAATYEAMLKRPENYIDVTLGLATTEDVLALANYEIATSDTYGVFRLKRIAQFEAEKAAILAGE